MNMWRRGVLTSSLPDWAFFKAASCQTQTTKITCSKTRVVASIIHISHGVLNKRGIITSNIDLFFWMRARMPASVISQHFGGRSAFICWNDSLCSASSQLKSAPEVVAFLEILHHHNLHHSVSFSSITFLYFYLIPPVTSGFCTRQKMGSHLL